MFTKACKNAADSAASTMSQVSARFAPAPAAMPFTAATTGFFKLMNAANERIEIVVQAFSNLFAFFAWLSLAHIQILTRTKSASRAGNQHGTNRRIRFNDMKNGMQFAQHVGVKTIEFIRAIQRDFGDAVGDVEQ